MTNETWQAAHLTQKERNGFLTPFSLLPKVTKHLTHLKGPDFIQNYIDEIHRISFITLPFPILLF